MHEESPKGCSCGKNTSRGGKAACKTSGTTSCPCVRKGKTCTRICICMNCCNAGQTVFTTADSSLNNMNITCRCGQNAAKNTSFVACQDGKRKSKCPCLGYGKGCSIACQCKGCGNIHGSSSRAPRSSVRGKRKRVEAIYRRENSSAFLRSAGMSTNAGPWTNYESILLVNTIKILSLTTITLSAKNISILFNFVVESIQAKRSPFSPSGKTTSQISAKMEFFGRKQAVENARISVGVMSGPSNFIFCLFKIAF